MDCVCSLLSGLILPSTKVLHDYLHLHPLRQLWTKVVGLSKSFVQKICFVVDIII